MAASGARYLPKICKNIERLWCREGILPIACNISYTKRSFSAAPAVQPVSKAKYGGRHMVTLVPGDGVGRELVHHAKEIIRYTGAPVDFEEITSDPHDDPDFINTALLAVKRNGVALKGSIETNIGQFSDRSKNVELRTQLDLFASVICCRSIPGIETRHNNIDLVIIRENTEGEYSNLEHENVPGVIQCLKIITEESSTRIAKFAFDFAVRHGRKKVTAVHKANIMKLGDGLFLECCTKVSKDYPDIAFESMIIDNCCMQMVSRPEQFDVMVMPNLYGNILGNIAAGLIGGPGVVSGQNIGEKYAIFESGTRNSGRSIMGKNIANPSALLLASADMLDYLGLPHHSEMIRDSVMKVLCEDKVHTPDLGGQATTLEVVQAIVKNIQEKTKKWW